MTRTFTTATRGLILAGALAFAAVPALAQTTPATPASPPAASSTGTGKTVTQDGKKAAAKTKKTHKTVAKKGAESKTPAAPKTDSDKKS